MELVTGRGNDILLGSRHNSVIVAGECALQRCGLTTHISDIIQAWTLLTVPPGIWNPIAMWYFNPMADKYFDTTPSPMHTNILEPTQERALLEYIMFHDYFDEGILIEGLKTYLFQHEDDTTGLYDELNKIPLPVDWLDYWLNEAREDCEI